MITQKQATKIKSWLKKTSSRMSQRFLFLLGGLKEIPKTAVNDILNIYDEIDLGFEILEKPLMRKFVETKDVVETFVGVALAHPKPAEYINNCLNECFETVLPRVRFELLYLNENEEGENNEIRTYE